jgi:hypothetical protein
MKNEDIDIDRQIHCLINPKKLDRTQILELHSMLIADVVGSIQCRECRRLAANAIKEKLLPHYLDQALRVPITEQFDHVH